MFSPVLLAKNTSSSSEKQFATEMIKNIISSEYNISEELYDLNTLKEHLYSMDLKNLGSIYSFSVDEYDIIGYIIVTREKAENGWDFLVNEVTLDSISPYFDNSSKNLYLSFGNYYEYKTDILIDCYSGTKYNYSEVIEHFNDYDVKYPSGGEGVPQNPETFYYDFYTTTEETTIGGFPLLHTAHFASNTSFVQENNCAPIAGTEITLFFDALHSNLISNFSPKYIDTNSELVYKDNGYYENVSPLSELQKLETLEVMYYSDMQTNNWLLLPTEFTDGVQSGTLASTGIGTLPTDFFNSMYNYFTSKGYVLNAVNIIEDENTNFGLQGESMSDGDNWGKYKLQIDQNRPVVLQLGVEWTFDYTMIKDPQTDIVLNSWYGLGSYTYNEFLGAHVVVGYGYKTYNFYNEYALIRKDEFMIVANGAGGKSYINIEDNDIGMAYGLYTYLLPSNC
jgi:hypothetical protein